MSATQEEDKKPGDGGAHINLKVKGQVIIISLPFFCFPLVCVLSVRVSDFKVSCVCVF